MSELKMCTCGPAQRGGLPVREDGEMRIYCIECDGVWGRTSLEKWNAFPPDQPVRVNESGELVYGPAPAEKEQHAQ